MERKNAYHESKSHGGGGFPFNIYPCSIPYDFPQVPVHWHEEMEVIVVKKGRGTVTVDTVFYELCQGEGIVVFPGQLHGMNQIDQVSMEYENIIFKLNMLMVSGEDICTAQFLEPLAEPADSKPLLIREGMADYEQFLSCIAQMDQCCQRRERGYQMAVKGLLFQFLYLVSRHNPLENGKKTRQSRERMKTLLSYVEQHFGEQITVEDGAALCYYSNSHFMKYFKQYMGISFVEYLNDYRLGKAADYLLWTEDSITAVAQRCGFDHISYFNRLFRRKYGRTPREYRQKNGIGL